METIEKLREASQRLSEHARNVGGDPSCERLYGLEAVEFSETANTAADELERLQKENGQLVESEAKAWRERNVACAKVRAWEDIVYVEGLPLRAIQVNEWGPGDGGRTTVPEITPKKLTELLDEIARLRTALQGAADV